MQAARAKIAEYAANNGLSVREYRHEVNAHLRDLVRDVPVYVRAPDHGALGFLNDGRWLTAHDTGGHQGPMMLRGRQSYERLAFGRTGAVYTYLGNTPFGAETPLGYGDIAFEMRPGGRALRGATVTFFDSMGSASNNHLGTPEEEQRSLEHFRQARDMGVLSEKSYQEWVRTTLVRTGTVPTPLTAPDYRSWDWKQSASGRDPLTVSSIAALGDVRWLGGNAYAEVQLHHGLRLSDVAAIHFRRMPSSDLSRAAVTAGFLPTDASRLTWRRQ